MANVACGFDVFGFAVDGPGDLVTAQRREAPGVGLTAIDGDDGRLPREAAKNTCGVAAAWLLDNVVDEPLGVDLRLEKRMPLASGLGSSAASAVAAAVAVNALFNLKLPRETLLRAAVEGERTAVGAAHADNAAASLYGGFVLARSGQDPEVVELPVPDGLSCAIIRPHVEVKTGEARAALGDVLELRKAIYHWGNTAAVVAALFRGDGDLLGSALTDHVAEPVRSKLVPGFAAMKTAALDNGAYGCSLAGSGPSTFALCATLEEAEAVADFMVEALQEDVEVDYDVIVSPLGVRGAHVVGASELLETGEFTAVGD